jgi:2-polyprenyl-3-methyl-5-hydroxy-6-metoxy-1,4-benzoquinol methylase
MSRITQKLEQMIQGVRQRLQEFVRRLKHGKGAEKRLLKELQQERERRRRAESRLRQRRNGAAAPAVTEHIQALPEPDGSINKLKIFRTLIPSLKPGRMLDLGSGRGNFSLAAAQLGWEVTAVDARTARTPDAEEEKEPEYAKLIRSVKWVQADVREFPIRSGEYDLICILGLLHHLEVDDQIKLLKRCSDTLTLLDTRIAPEIVDTEGPYEGAYKREHGETREERDQIPTASWGNEVSFRHTEESLLRLVRDCGYSKLMAMRPPHRRNYTFYLCLPPPP